MTPDIEILTDPGEQDWRILLDRDDLKLHIRMLGASLDPAIEAAIKDAIAYFSAGTGGLGRTLMPTTYDMYRPCFPVSGVMRVPYPPLRTVTSVTYRDDAGATQTLNSALYIVRKNPTIPGEIVFIDSNDIPDTAEHPRAVKITFTAGYGIGTGEPPVPANLRRAIKFLAAHYIENAEATINESKVVTINRKVDFGVDSLVAQLKVPHEYGDWD